MTFEVSNLETSNDVKDLQPSNIELISVIFDVLRLLTSNEVNDLQPLNILFISVTFNSSKLDKFIDFKSPQFSNMNLIELILLTSI